ncbi:DNA sulfur modification protein DndB [Scopulibacillus cellulosilyticus]|uniref:DNA sulfur modification protein DndB n=1 Tax=Scopulibacillus cellulosilyticus TaxID=2665665 RepID=A0ABW2PWJ6_9BACL
MVLTYERNIEQTYVIYKVRDLIKMVEENKIKLRSARQAQVSEIKKYIFDNIKEQKVYLPPVVANCRPEDWNDGQPTRFEVIDGSKRILALHQLPSLIEQMLKEDQSLKKVFLADEELNDSSFGIQMFKGLTPEECDQLFIDFNTKGKKVALSKRIAYDSRNEINKITNELLIQNLDLKDVAGIEMEKHAVVKPPNKKLLSLAQLRNIVAIFIRGKITKQDLNKVDIDGFLSTNEYVHLLHLWFDKLFQCHSAKTIGDYEITILASYPMLLAIALYANEDLERVPFEKRQAVIEERMDRIRHIDWLITNKQWRKFKGNVRGRRNIYYLDKDKSSLNQIVGWLKSEAES